MSNEKTTQTSANNEENGIVGALQADESTKKASENTSVTANYNIRNARIADVNYVKSFAVNGKTLSDALSEVVKLAQSPQVTGVILKDDEEIITVTDQLLEFAHADEKTVNETVHRLMMEFIKLHAENADLRLSIERKQLQKGEVIIQFTDKTIEQIRKVRPFIAKSSYLNYEKNNDSDFRNKLVNHAVQKVLRIDFDNVVNPL